MDDPRKTMEMLLAEEGQSQREVEIIVERSTTTVDHSISMWSVDRTVTSVTSTATVVMAPSRQPGGVGVAQRPLRNTPPATVLWQHPDMQDLSSTLSFHAGSVATVQRSRSATLVDHMSQMMEHLQPKMETVQSKKKRSMSCSPKNWMRAVRPSLQEGQPRLEQPRQMYPNLEQPRQEHLIQEPRRQAYPGLEQPRQEQPRQVYPSLEQPRQEQPRQEQPRQEQSRQEQSRQEHLDREIDRIIRNTLKEGTVPAILVDGLRNYLRSNRDQRFNQLMKLQHDQRVRMQREFDRQQQVLIAQICTETDVTEYRYAIPQEQPECTRNRF
ncbi:adenylate cyclase, terminal-differentiation specific-like isoform X2 [Drosophila pseudoobscura]|uniref:Adenylate cyclase, terminal-differentiation specific-like isoform X1 n=1 Tax=Drosophila pseudoobscura pseudoobscura TaxID=46245 RepID=A0A6I8VX21_DROPS|nr:adenylate cyclase, terminal-differentiation specific-like isoform X1 [Drosophila pseudoobscura]XP_033235630.1 adenylate cyclase, terminal-differentiation specific-like isoform X2 [Drosophila pseudoobscura]